MKTIDNYNFSGKKALVRVDFNVPLDKATLEVTDDTRIRAAIDTIKKILNDGGSVILMSHLGRPKDGPADKYSLRHVVRSLEALLGRHVQFVADCIGPDAVNAAAGLQNGEVLLLENLRFHKEEEKGDETFAKKLASLGDVYVNDAFGTAHRRHASTAVIAEFFPGHKFFGYVMANEVNHIERVLGSAQHPFTAITGGAKVSDKILIIEQLLEKVDHLIIGGGMAYTFFRAMGGTTGSSLCEEDKLDLATDIIEKAKSKNVHIHLPVDSVIANVFSNEADYKVVLSGEIPDGWMGLDIGPKAIAAFTDVILHSKTILWNGPMGVFEMSHFENGTKEIAAAVAKATTSGAFSLIGGGDSAAAVNKYGYSNAVSYVSTGGGALLEYIEGKKLPGVEMLLAD
ncbi:MAG TPA: phosphoglycerate kinase [Bacteroidia bacterium]|nr:phosphoglycerate kinase [Bacteroidia bacterium]